MPLLRRYLHWTAIALLAIFAPPFALAIWAAETFRIRKRRLARLPERETVVAFLPRPVRTRSEPRPEDGAVVLAFRPRASPAMTLDEPPALTGSR